jgi:hypothetical protein
VTLLLVFVVVVLMVFAFTERPSYAQTTTTTPPAATTTIDPASAVEVTSVDTMGAVLGAAGAVGGVVITGWAARRALDVFRSRNPQV